MSKNRKNAMIYFGAAILLAVACFFNIKNNDYVFVGVCGISAIIFFIAGLESHKSIKRKKKNNDNQSKKAKSTNNNPYRNGKNKVNAKKLKKSK